MAFTGSVRRPDRRPPSRRLVVLVSVLVVVAIATVITMVLLPRSDGYARASSVADGGDLQALVSGRSSSIAWRSVSQTTGAWVETRWPRPQEVDRVRATAAGEHTFVSGRLTFSDDSALLVTPNAEGALDVSFPKRRATWARLTVTAATAGKESVSLASFVVSDDGDAVSTADPALTVTASSSAEDTTPQALVDGDPRRDSFGEEWRARPADSSARATVAWDGAREVSAVRIWGPTESAFDPAYSAAAALNGTLRFSDGSEVRISGIAGGSGEPTTIGFTPRMVTSATVVLEKTIPQATIGLRAVAVYLNGELPRVTASSTAQAGSTEAAACNSSTAPVGRAASDVISLVCPAVGATVGGKATLRIAASAGTAFVATTSTGVPERIRQLGSGTTDADGAATVTFSTADLPHGPFTVLVQPTVTPLRPLHVQLFNGEGVSVSAAPAKHGAAALVWDDEFDATPTMSASGAGATYAAAKPEYWGTSQFGDAAFDDPASGAGTFSVVDGALRIKAQALGSRVDPAGNGARYRGGLLSSLRVGATGFSAQYGYYEARIMAPAGNGTWPAFWTMNDDSATKMSMSSPYTEVDAVELYGNNTKQTCHSIHDYVDKKDNSDVQCINPSMIDDWATGWHTYGVQIEPGQAAFYIDGKLVKTLVGLPNSEQPFYFIANLAVGGGWPVDLTPTGDRADLWIDYIRVYV